MQRTTKKIIDQTLDRNVQLNPGHFTELIKNNPEQQKNSREIVRGHRECQQPYPNPVNGRASGHPEVSVAADASLLGGGLSAQPAALRHICQKVL